MSKIHLHSIVTIVACLIFTVHLQVSHAQNIREIGLTIETDIVIYNNKDDQWTEDLTEALLLNFYIADAFNSLKGVKVVSSNLSEKKGIFGIIVNISRPPGSSYYTLNYSTLAKFLMDWDDTEDPNKQVWIHHGTVQYVINNPRESIDIIASIYYDTRIKPIMNMF